MVSCRVSTASLQLRSLLQIPITISLTLILACQRGDLGRLLRNQGLRRGQTRGQTSDPHQQTCVRPAQAVDRQRGHVEPQSEPSD